jgi:leader peptidase (prepilin peptidase)/N-methyltransferase
MSLCTWGSPCPSSPCPSGTLPDVNTLLIAGTSLAGIIGGGALDPLGQKLADASRAAEVRRRAETQERETDAMSSDSVPHGGGEDTDNGAGQRDHTRVRPPDEGAVRNLLPAGPSFARTVGCALVTGALFGGAASYFGADLILAPFCVFITMLVMISVTDLSHRLVPRRVIYAALALVIPLLVLTSAVDHRWYSLSGSVIAAAVAFGLFFAMWWFIPRGMGFGDVRLAGVIGLTVGYLSLLHAYVAFLAGFIVGMVFGLVVIVIASTGRKTRIPFAPSLAVGAVFAVFWGGHVAHSLFHAGT